MRIAARTTLRRWLGLALALSALWAPAASAQRATGAFYPAVPVDGPSADIRGGVDVDLARDGSGALSYVKRIGDEDHVFLSPIAGGIAQPPLQIDPGLTPVLGQPAVASSDGGRVVVVWGTGDGAWYAVRPAADQPFSPPALLGGAGSSNVVVDTTVTGVSYAAWSEGGNVRGAYMARRQNAFAPYPDALDAAIGDEAGGGAALRPRIATSADGSAVVVWGEQDAAITRVFARRLVKGRASAVFADATLNSLDGAAGASAEMPDVGIEDDSSYAWVVFRQRFDDGSAAPAPRAIARRLRGSAFDDPVVLDGGAGVVGAPRVAINGRGQGMVTLSSGSGATLVSEIRDDALTPAQIVGSANGVLAQPVSGTAENFDGLAAYLQAPAPGQGAEARAVVLEDDVALPSPPVFGADGLLSAPALGPVDPGSGLDVDVDRAGDGAAVFVQGPAGARSVVLAVYDRTPGIPTLNSTTNWRRFSRPPLVWSDSFDLWGGVSYQVLIDGQPVATTVESTLTPVNALFDGIHRWQVVATDRRGQVARSESRNLRVDATPPNLVIKIGGKRRTGKPITFGVRAIDLRSPLGSGISKARVDFGDGSPPVGLLQERFTLIHSFARGSYQVRISATDTAGNVVVAFRSLVIKNPPKPKKKKKKGKSKKKSAKQPAALTPDSGVPTGGATPAP